MTRDHIERLMRLEQLARSRAAIESSCMSDYVDIDHVRYYRPTLAHLWLRIDLEMSVAMNEATTTMVSGYLLHHHPRDCRMRLQRAIECDAKAVVADAVNWFMCRQSHLPAVSSLAADFEALNQANDDDAGSPLDYDWWAQLVYPIAAHFNWSEDRIFALPLRRLAAYNRVLTVANTGKAVRRQTPDLPETIALRKALEAM